MQGIQGIQGIQGTDGTQGIDGGFGGACFDYTFDSSVVSSDPGTGKVRLNSAAGTAAGQKGATKMYVDIEDDGGTSIQNFLAAIDANTSAVKGHVKIINKSDATQFLLFSIPDLTDNTGWWTIDISNQAFSTADPFSNLEDVLLCFVTTGEKGDTGAQGIQGVQGTVGIQGIQGITGTQGIQGIQGIQGTQGTQGTNEGVKVFEESTSGARLPVVFIKEQIGGPGNLAKLGEEIDDNFSYRPDKNILFTRNLHSEHIYVGPYSVIISGSSGNITSSGNFSASGAVIASIGNFGSITASVISGSDLNTRFIIIPSSSNATQQDASLYFGGPGSSPTSNVGFIYGDGSGGDKDLVLGVNDSEVVQINEVKGVLINSNITASVGGGGNISASGYITAQHITSSGNISASGTVIGKNILDSSINFFGGANYNPVLSGSIDRLFIGDVKENSSGLRFDMNDGTSTVTLESQGDPGTAIFNVEGSISMSAGIGGGGTVLAENAYFGSNTVIISGSSGNITSSGNFSASGAIIGAQFTSSDGILITSSLTGLGASSPFIIEIDNNPVFSVSSSGVVVYGNLATLPTPVTGGLVYSASNFYMGLE